MNSNLLAQVNAQAATLWARWRPSYDCGMRGRHFGQLIRTTYSNQGFLVADFSHPLDNVVETWGVKPHPNRPFEVVPYRLARRAAATHMMRPAPRQPAPSSWRTW
jgi:hypothetical protein